MPDDPADYWQLDPELTQLNHGSFGACPEPILRAQQALRARMEREPTRFFTREAPEFAERARSALGDFVDVDARDLVLVPNATAALNSVLRSLPLRPGDEILISDHQYNATRNMTQFAARRAGARVVTAQIPFPLGTDDETDASDTIVAAVMRHVGPRTRLAILDHVTSPTGLVLPIERLIRALSGSGAAGGNVACRWRAACRMTGEPSVPTNIAWRSGCRKLVISASPHPMSSTVAGSGIIELNISLTVRRKRVTR